MKTRDESAPTVTIGGREVDHLEAALIAQEADRLGVSPGAVGEVAIPRRAPRRVVLSGYRLTLATAAKIAAVAGAKGVPPVRVIEAIAEEYVESLNRKRTRKTRRNGSD
ncbi:MAG TPA: hypothetical protein VK447_02810 [Myxococcaceae bacterium]|nr:hypothetical protein [Myxococcaceae bacterium]